VPVASQIRIWEYMHAEEAVARVLVSNEVLQVMSQAPVVKRDARYLCWQDNHCNHCTRMATGYSYGIARLAGIWRGDFEFSVRSRLAQAEWW
jgi:hypothetical protein